VDDLRFIGSILESYSDVKIGILTGRELNIREFDQRLEKLKSNALMVAKNKIGKDPVTRQPFVASWREVYRSFGTKPADYRPSAEALVRRAMKLGSLPVINTAVDVYNAVSLKYLIPMGGFDINKVQGDIYLRFSHGGEAFTPLGPSEVEETYPGEVIYADDARVLTRRWNYRDCEETKITAETRNVVMFIDCTGAVPRETTETALSDLRSLLAEYCGGVYNTKIAEGVNNVVELG
jgi:DNA/RNA-binding domain of Phe-tRNA-synthetase-like protein